MPYIVNQRKISILCIIVSAIGSTYSCTEETRHNPVSQLATGELILSPAKDTITCDDCLHFTSRSDLVADAKEGMIKIDEPFGNWLGTLVMYSGGLGNWFVGETEEGARLISELRSSGYRVIQLKWDEGWFIGSPGKYEGFKKLAVHPATATRYIYDELSGEGKPFILFGGSGGAAQIAYMLSFYGIDKITSAAVIFGGFWMGRLDIGCFDKDSLKYYMHYSDRAKQFVDLSFGFDFETAGPCENCDTRYLELYKSNSVSWGGNYYFPNSDIYLIYGGNDRVGALNQGLSYYRELTAANSPLVHMQVIEGAPHGILFDSTGYEVLRNILLNQIREKVISENL